MPKTYETIARQVLTIPSASITFSSISSAYTDLVLVVHYQCSTNGGLFLRYNGDSGNNYSVVNMIGTQNTIATYADANEPYIWADTYYQGTGSVLSDRAIVRAQVMNYSSTAAFKTTLCRGDNVRTTGATDGTVNANVSTWRSTSAITQIGVLPSGGNFVSGSTFTLYGILKA